MRGPECEVVLTFEVVGEEPGDGPHCRDLRAEGRRVKGSVEDRRSYDCAPTLHQFPA